MKEKKLRSILLCVQLQQAALSGYLDGVEFDNRADVLPTSEVVEILKELNEENLNIQTQIKLLIDEKESNSVSITGNDAPVVINIVQEK